MLSTFLGIGLVVAVAVGIWLKTRTRLLGSAEAAARAQAEAFSEQLDKLKPRERAEAAVRAAESEIDQLASQIAEASSTKDAIIRRLDRAVDERGALEKEALQLDAAADDRRKKGDIQGAEQLEAEAANMAEAASNKAAAVQQLEQAVASAKANYLNLERRFASVQGTVARAKSEAQVLGAKLETAQLESKMANVGKQFGVKTGAIASLDGHFETLQQAIDQQLAHARIVRPMDNGPAVVQEFREEQRKARGRELLDALKAKKNVGAPNGQVVSTAAAV